MKDFSSAIDASNIIPYITHPSVLLLAFLIVLSITAVISVILIFHWQRYGEKNTHIAFAELVYFPGVIVFVSLALMSLVTFSSGL